MSVNLLDNVGLIEHLLFSDRDYIDIRREIFARLFLVWLLLFVYGLLVLSRTVRSQLITERWHWVLLILFALGAACALGDPLHGVATERNWIRYWTAGVLGVAGVVAVVNSLSAEHPLLDRVFSGLFGLLLVTAASDELFQFHEQAGPQVDALLPSEFVLSGGDMVTLAVAAFGAAVVVMAVLVWRFMPRAKALLREPRYRRTFAMFALAVFSFLTAVMLDSFDWYLEHLTDQLRATILSQSEFNEVPRWLGVDYITQAANSLEELLEYLAAIFFLLMIGALLSVRAMGFGLQSNMRGTRA